MVNLRRKGTKIGLGKDPDRATKPVLRPRGARGFVVLLRRWKVERSIGWIMNARCYRRHYERLPQHSEAHLN